MIWEMCKGEESFWAPYFECASWAELPYLWNTEELAELEDELLSFEIKEYGEEIE